MLLKAKTWCASGSFGFSGATCRSATPRAPWMAASWKSASVLYRARALVSRCSASPSGSSPTCRSSSFQSRSAPRSSIPQLCARSSSKRFRSSSWRRNPPESLKCGLPLPPPSAAWFPPPPPAGATAFHWGAWVMASARPSATMSARRSKGPRASWALSVARAQAASQALRNPGAAASSTSSSWRPGWARSAGAGSKRPRRLRFT
mmetsp:Transcript_4362/g.7779  ORF Transcript_4362/g.7779 Transcript_4362/m.7779 type:complete len:205 (-) Transcript_4362:42-656(-)